MSDNAAAVIILSISALAYLIYRWIEAWENVKTHERKSDETD